MVLYSIAFQGENTVLLFPISNMLLYTRLFP